MDRTSSTFLLIFYNKYRRIKIFKIKKIKDDEFEIVSFNPRKFIEYNKNEPGDGIIRYQGELYYFRFSYEFDLGNTYLVYKGMEPVFYFKLYSKIDSGMLKC